MKELILGAVIAGVAIFLVTTIGVSALQVVYLMLLSQMLSLGIGGMALGLSKIAERQAQRRVYYAYNPSSPQSSPDYLDLEERSHLGPQHRPQKG